ncbi:flagellar basal-body rod protein FlgF [Aquabacter spiritensis]|uniref:Flagellar basal-body rod protein FlgF n=1 Tax=Aquabacter spiritensis TaxID=933073 RepID=A0A4R3M5R3_9HYPH|nr:flagellar basal-body rod protein FlgF [Aquabacter spiritensis]TCT07943.1 flagellar basal-body rod protein FlgF [Aquabacter spiritensis]
MSSGVHIALSAQMTMERRMSTIAVNLANMNTPGYRAEEVRFETLMSKPGPDGVAFASAGQAYTSLRSGQVTYSGNPLDVAVQGDVWLALQTPGGRVLTRDGRLQMTATGELKSVAGHAVLDPGGTAILLDPAAGQVEIGMDGAITQAGRTVGSIGLFEMPAGAQIARYGNSGLIPDGQAAPIIDFTGKGLRQGYIEGANVDPILEMTKMIMVQRAFESAAMAVQQSEDLTQQAITSLGPGT